MYKYLQAYTLAILAASSCTQLNAATYIHAGKLIAADNDKVQQNVTVIVDGNKIKSIQSALLMLVKMTH